MEELKARLVYARTAVVGIAGWPNVADILHLADDDKAALLDQSLVLNLYRLPGLVDPEVQDWAWCRVTELVKLVSTLQFTPSELLKRFIALSRNENKELIPFAYNKYTSVFWGGWREVQTDDSKTWVWQFDLPDAAELDWSEIFIPAGLAQDIIHAVEHGVVRCEERLDDNIDGEGHRGWRPYLFDRSGAEVRISLHYFKY